MKIVQVDVGRFSFDIQTYVASILLFLSVIQIILYVS